MTNLYRHQDWIRFRQDVIKLHGGCCSRCGRSAQQDGVTLQVHHKRYVGGRKPWEYAYIDCEALCKGCHAQEHGLIMPQSGWELIASDDLGEVCGECELCGTNLRYVFAIQHLNWGAMAVGTDCCDRLTLTNEASEYHEARLKRAEMLKRFINSKRWKNNKRGFLSITRNDISGYIIPDGGKFRIGIGGIDGKEEHGSILDAKIKIFDFIHSGEAKAFLHDRAVKLLESSEQVSPNDSDVMRGYYIQRMLEYFRRRD